MCSRFIHHMNTTLRSVTLVVNRAKTALTEGLSKTRGVNDKVEVYKWQPRRGRRESLNPDIADGLATQVDGHALQQLCGEAGAA